MKAVDALRLGRVSNLPTVWTNVLAGLLLAGGAAEGDRLALLLLAMSLAYVGGMYLNDAFDAEIDARERPERPIPAGRVSRGTVFSLGFGMLAVSILCLLALGFAAALGGVALAGAIVAYDRHHKGNPLSPLLMGLCRVLVYVTAGLAVAVAFPAPLVLGAAALLAWLIGLTYTAKQENIGRVENMWPLLFLLAPLVYGVVLGFSQPVVILFVLLAGSVATFALRLIRRRGPGDIPAAVGALIAGISLVDAMLIASTGALGLAALAALAFPLTLALQRVVPGT